MKLFDTKPKSDPHFLYGREKELENLVDYLSEKNWVILLGPRRIGKTSLAECAITKLKQKAVILDARENNNFVKGLNDALAKEGSISIKAGIKVPHLPINLEIDYKKNLSTKNLNSAIKKTKHFFVLIDEAQWLKNPKKVVMLLAHLYDYYYENITFIITGSMIGVMKSIIDPGAQSPLYGRAITKMEIKRWGSSTSISFLKAGTKEIGLDLDDKSAVNIEEHLDGLPGWLTLFGYNYSHIKNPNSALTETIKEAKKIISQELKSIAELGIGSPRLLAILKGLSKEPMRFVDLLDSTGFSNAVLSNHLNTLNKLGYVEKNEKDRYFISDPMLAQFISGKIE